MEKATQTLFFSGESPKGLGRDILYVVLKYMLRRGQKTSHFGVGENVKKMSENLENVEENKKKKSVIFKSF